MASTPGFGFNELFTHVVGEIAKAVCERSGETAQQQFARSQAAVHMILGFLPRDVIEALLAGHCVMLHETMLAGVHDTLLGEADAMRRCKSAATEISAGVRATVRASIRQPPRFPQNSAHPEQILAVRNRYFQLTRVGSFRTG